MVSNLAHFQHVLLPSFQVRFLLDFVICLRPCGAPFGTIFQEKPFGKSIQKKGTSFLKTSDYGAVQGLLETPPRVRADSIQINSTQAQFNSIQIELELEMAV